MVLTTYTLDIGNEKALDAFDTVTHIAYGISTITGTTDPTDTGLQAEAYRRPIESKTQDTLNGLYTFETRLPITQLVSETITEIGLFDAASGGNLAVRIILTNPISKTDSDEILITIRLKVNSKNN